MNYAVMFVSFTTEKEERCSKQTFLFYINYCIFDFISNLKLLHAISFLQDNLILADLHWVT